MKQFGWSVPFRWSLAIFVLTLWAYVWQGSNAWWTIHDGIDSEVSFRVLPLHAGVLFSTSNDALVPQVMNGLPRNSFNASSFNFISLLFALLPAAWAYLINTVLVKLVAFLGMYLLLSQKVVRGAYSEWLAGALALGFASLPVYAVYGITVPGLPLLLWSYWSILQGKSRAHWLTVVLYPFWSSFVLGGFAVVLLSGTAFLVALLRANRIVAFRALAITLVLGVLFFVSDFNLFNQFLFNKDYVPHRTDWVMTAYTLKVSVYSAFMMWWKGQYHAPSEHLVLLLGFPFLFYFGRKALLQEKVFVVAFCLVTAFALLYGFWRWQPVAELRSHFSLLKTFQFDRFFFLNPVLWIVAFAAATNVVRSPKSRSAISVFALLYPVVVLATNSEWKANALGRCADRTAIRWNDYFVPETMADAMRTIGESPASYRTICIALDPAVPQLAGFYTLDSYQNNYPIEYKRQFRQLISCELVPNNSFDAWGSKCVVPYHDVDPETGVLNSLNIDFDTLRDMGGKVVFSLLPLNEEHIPVHLAKQYPDAYNGWDLYVYVVGKKESQESGLAAR